MKIKAKKIAIVIPVLLATLLVWLVGCNHVGRTTGTTLVGTGVGAGVGAIAGGSKGTAIGAGAGALSGFLVGVYEDKREEKMRREAYERQRRLDYEEYERVPPRDPEYEEFLRWKREHEYIEPREP